MQMGLYPVTLRVMYVYRYVRYVYVCMCLCMYVSMYVCFYVRMYANNVTRSSNTTLANRQQCIIYYFDN
jgi:hypothetical protein